MSEEIWTVGHGTASEDEFLATLRGAGIEVLADVRSFPGSRRNPQFGREVMPAWLADAGIEYVHLPALGGRRRKQDVDPALNGGWELAAFHNYADYTLSEEYREALGELEALARRRRVAVMCSETVPWRCHRSLLASTLVARGWTVWHLIGNAPPRRHEIGAWGATPVVAADGTVTYPSP